MPDSDTGPDLTAAGAVLRAAVREGGALALQKFRSPFKSWTKERDSPVSEVDIAVDALLRERLMAVAGCAWLSEESVDDPARLDAASVWIVDPIDGTRAFIAGREDWVISAALVHRGRPVLGAIYVPVENALFFARTGEGASVNGTPVTTNAGGEFHGARASGPKRLIEALQMHYPVEAAARVHSLALRLARVATGALDIAFAGGNSHDWDIAAADLIVHEAGGVLTDLDGANVIYNRPDPVHRVLVAVDRGRHHRVVRALRDSHLIAQ